MSSTSRLILAYMYMFRYYLLGILHTHSSSILFLVRQTHVPHHESVSFSHGLLWSAPSQVGGHHVSEGQPTKEEYTYVEGKIISQGVGGQQERGIRGSTLKQCGNADVVVLP